MPLRREPRLDHHRIMDVETSQGSGHERAHVSRDDRAHGRRRGTFGNDPSAGSPTETLLRLHLPLNVEV